VRRGRLLRQVVPILETGMERAIALAESMDSRGFGHRGASRSDAVAGWLSLGALLSLGACFVALIGRADALALGLAVVGVAGVVAAVVVAGRSSSRVRYRRRRLRRSDWLLAATAWVAPVGLALLAAADDATLVWPADRLGLPGLNLLAVVAIAALAVPARRTSPS
jgi:energy-coupling factor transport system permease protein